MFKTRYLDMTSFIQIMIYRQLKTLNDMVAIADGSPPAPDDGPRHHVFCYGPFTFDGRRLVTNVEGGSDPIWGECSQVRDVRFDGNRLIASPSVGLLGPLDVRREMTWEHIS